MFVTNPTYVNSIQGNMYLFAKHPLKTFELIIKYQNCVRVHLFCYDGVGMGAFQRI